LNFLIFKIEVPTSLKIGPGLVIPHPQGTVLGAQEIGANVTIFHQVTLGAKTADFSYDLSQRPKVCDGVTLSVGSKVLGALTLGEGAIIGANAVVLDDIPPGTTAVGIPAKALR
jgi:serine O-acetyltransferase